MLRGAAALFALATHACTASPTEALVRVATDVPADRSMLIRASIASVGASDSDSHTWSRAYGDAGGIALPASFAVLPAVGGALDARVALTLTADVGPGPHGEPPGEIVRVVVFRFVPYATQQVAVVLARACLDAATGCTSVPAAQCTQSVRCADLGATCGDQGACVAVDPTRPFDAAVDVPAPPADVTDAPPADARSIDAAPPAPDAFDAAPPAPDAFDAATDVPPSVDARVDAAPCGAIGEACCSGDRCNAGAACDAHTGTCACAPDCAGRACGPDGCGGSCGGCPTCRACDGHGACAATTDGTTCSGPPDGGLYACCAGTCTSLTTATNCGGCGLGCGGTNPCLATATPLCLCGGGVCPRGQTCIATMYISYCACSPDAGCAPGQACEVTHCAY